MAALRRLVAGVGEFDALIAGGALAFGAVTAAANQAVDAVEQVSPDLLEQCELMALIGLAAKLPPHLAEERPRLQTNLASQLILHNFEMIDV